MNHLTRRRHRAARPLVVALLAPTLAFSVGTGTAAHAGVLDGLDDLLSGDGGDPTCQLQPDAARCDSTPPETTITGSMPMPVNGVITRKSVTFSFSGAEEREGAQLSFECRLVTPTEQDPAFLPCDRAEGAQYSLDEAPLESYRFEVKATDDATGPLGQPEPNTDPTPAMQAFGVDTIAPETRRFSAPSFYEASRSAEFVHGTSEAGAGYACTLDGAPLTCDEDYLLVRDLSSGKHRMQVAAMDEYGNADRTPVTTTWWVPRNQLGGKAERTRWKTTASSDAFDNDLLTTRSKGAELTQKLRGVRSVGLVVKRGDGFGRLRVKFNKKTLQVIDLDDRSATSATISMDLPGRTKRKGTLRVIPLDRAPVAVDAFFAS